MSQTFRVRLLPSFLHLGILDTVDDVTSELITGGDMVKVVSSRTGVETSVAGITLLSLLIAMSRSSE